MSVLQKAQGFSLHLNPCSARAVNSDTIYSLTYFTRIAPGGTQTVHGLHFSPHSLLFCAAASMFFQLFLYPVVHISFPDLSSKCSFALLLWSCGVLPWQWCYRTFLKCVQAKSSFFVVSGSALAVVQSNRSFTHLLPCFCTRVTEIGIQCRRVEGVRLRNNKRRCRNATGGGGGVIVAWRLNHSSCYRSIAVNTGRALRSSDC